MSSTQQTMLETSLIITLSFTTIFFLIQIFYGFVFLQVARYESLLTTENNFLKKQEPISVIVACRNEAENLQRLIPALLAQKYSNFEVILVDDRSYDDTRQVIFDAQNLDKRIRLVRIDDKPDKPDEPDGKKFALTMGIKAAKYDRLLFTDADCLPNTENWIAEMATNFTEDKKFVLGVSLYHIEDNFLNSFVQIETLFTVTQYLSWALMGSPYMGVGRNLAYRKSMFLENNGFYQHLRVVGGDDDLIVNRLAKDKETAICLHPESQTNSPAKNTWKSWYVQKKRHLSVGKHYKFADKLRTSCFLFSIVFFFLAICTQVVFGFFAHVDWLYYVAAGFVFIRYLFLALVLQAIAKKINLKTSLWLYPFWEFVYVIYQIYVGFVALTSSKIAWR